MDCGALCHVAAKLDNGTRGVARLSASSLMWIDQNDPSKSWRVLLRHIACFQQSKASVPTAKLRITTQDGKKHTLDMSNPAGREASFKSRDLLRDMLQMQLDVLHKFKQQSLHGHCENRALAQYHWQYHTQAADDRLRQRHRERVLARQAEARAVAAAEIVNGIPIEQLD